MIPACLTCLLALVCRLIMWIPSTKDQDSWSKRGERADSLRIDHYRVLYMVPEQDHGITAGFDVGKLPGFAETLSRARELGHEGAKKEMDGLKAKGLRPRRPLGFLRFWKQ